mmetsp:Transcript_12367/g.32875  ORF Transcript_12367/g.32875 Transcript_12367/m.32875 type:complete len:216 (-) Transcript_12367:348-995(-)
MERNLQARCQPGSIPLTTPPGASSITIRRTSTSTRTSRTPTTGVLAASAPNASLPADAGTIALAAQVSPSPKEAIQLSSSEPSVSHTFTWTGHGGSSCGVQWAFAITPKELTTNDLTQSHSHASSVWSGRMKAMSWSLVLTPTPDKASESEVHEIHPNEQGHGQAIMQAHSTDMKAAAHVRARALNPAKLRHTAHPTGAAHVMGRQPVRWADGGS